MLCIVSEQNLNYDGVTKQKNCAKHNSTIKPRDIQVVELSVSGDRSRTMPTKLTKSRLRFVCFFITGYSIWTISCKMNHLATQQALSIFGVARVVLVQFLLSSDHWKCWRDFDGGGRLAPQFFQPCPRPRDSDREAPFSFSRTLLHPWTG